MIVLYRKEKERLRELETQLSDYKKKQVKYRDWCMYNINDILL